LRAPLKYLAEFIGHVAEDNTAGIPSFARHLEETFPQPIVTNNLAFDLKPAR
jgi:hypothetical protein